MNWLHKRTRSEPVKQSTEQLEESFQKPFTLCAQDKTTVAFDVQGSKSGRLDSPFRRLSNSLRVKPRRESTQADLIICRGGKGREPLRLKKSHVFESSEKVVGKPNVKSVDVAESHKDSSSKDKDSDTDRIVGEQSESKDQKKKDNVQEWKYRKVSPQRKFLEATQQATQNQLASDYRSIPLDEVSVASQSEEISNETSPQTTTSGSVKVKCGNVDRNLNSNAKTERKSKQVSVPRVSRRTNSSPHVFGIRSSSPQSPSQFLNLPAYNAQGDIKESQLVAEQNISSKLNIPSRSGSFSLVQSDLISDIDQKHGRVGSFSDRGYDYKLEAHMPEKGVLTRENMEWDKIERSKDAEGRLHKVSSPYSEGLASRSYFSLPRKYGSSLGNILAGSPPNVGNKTKVSAGSDNLFESENHVITNDDKGNDVVFISTKRQQSFEPGRIVSSTYVPGEGDVAKTEKKFVVKTESETKKRGIAFVSCVSHVTKEIIKCEVAEDETAGHVQPEQVFKVTEEIQLDGKTCSVDANHTEEIISIDAEQNRYVYCVRVSCGDNFTCVCSPK